MKFTGNNDSNSNFFPFNQEIDYSYIKWYRLQNNVACLLDCQAVWSLADVSPSYYFFKAIHS